MTTSKDSRDPRPAIDLSDGTPVIVGAECIACAHRFAVRPVVCRACGGPVRPARFGPEGTVWSATVVRIETGARVAPYALAYVELAAGPRFLAHVGSVDERLKAGAAVRLVGPTSAGDPLVEVAR